MPARDLSLSKEVRIRHRVRIDQRDLRAKFNAALNGGTKLRIRARRLAVHSRHEQLNESLPLLDGYLATTVDDDDPGKAPELLRVPLWTTEGLTQKSSQVIHTGVHRSAGVGRPVRPDRSTLPAAATVPRQALHPAESLQPPPAPLSPRSRGRCRVPASGLTAPGTAGAP
jgi:hypothetical protein